MANSGPPLRTQNGPHTTGAGPKRYSPPGADVASGRAAQTARSCPPRALVFGVSGPVVTEGERQFFAQADPLGFILFSRNCIQPDQVRALITALRATVGRADAPVLVDQEGGRVARLTPPHWRAAPAPASFAALAQADEAAAHEAAWWNARLIAAELADLGITVDCAPVLDVPQPGAHPVIGDRSVGDTPERVVALGRIWCDGLLAGGVLPVIKHLPGHGRALVDSHERLPRVAAHRVDLERVDFLPFRALKTMPWAMTAHVVYEDLDSLAPATTSSTIIDGVIRNHIGFDGVLISDDICMGALDGPMERRAIAALDAGCDVVLHCNGVLEEMVRVAAACPRLSGQAQDRLAAADAMRHVPDPFDRAAALLRLESLLNGATVAP